MKRMYDPCTDTWAFPDGSGLITRAQKNNLELFRMKWKMRHAEGNPDVKAMLDEYRQLQATEQNGGED